MAVVEVSELSGAALDWAVAKCEGFLCDYTYNGSLVAYSTDWAQGGPIIERESIAVDYSDGQATEKCSPYWCASSYYSDTLPHSAETPLVAAMRCYVASKLGETVEIPNELV